MAGPRHNRYVRRSIHQTGFFGTMVQTLIGLLLLFALAACGGAGDTGSSSGILEENPVQAPLATGTDAPVRIALVMKTLTNPFFVDMEVGARHAEEELGIELIVKTGAQETSIEQQIAIVEELIEDKVDAIVIAPGSSTELVPVLKKAQDAGIPVINIDNRLDAALSQRHGLVGVPFISVNNVAAAYQSAKCIADRIDTPTDVVLLEGIREARNAQDRKTGAKKAFAENPNIRLVATETAHWKIDEAYEVTGDLFQAYPAIGAIFAANDMMALGALKYLQDHSMDNVMVASFDALEEAQQAIKEGWLLCTINQQADRQGYLGVQYAVRALRGETLPLETLIEAKLVAAADLR